MSTELMTIDQNALANLDALLGADPSQTESGGSQFTPNLKINYDDEDEHGNELKKGVWYVSGEDPRVYAKSVKFRPLAQFFKWMDYSADEQKYVNQTILVPDMRKEARDAKGTIKCGRPNAKVLAENEALKKQFASVKAYRVVYGLVSYEGETAKGEKVTVTNLPVVMNLKGASFMGFEDEYVKKLGQGRKLYDHAIELTSVRQKAGGTTFFTVGYAPDFKTVIPVDQATFETMTHIVALVKENNDKIEKLYQAALSGQQTDERAMSGVNKFLDLELDDDMNDQIPF